jgi:hypothetical protein
MTDQQMQPEKVLYLKYWHIVLMLVVQLVCLGIAYGKLSQAQDDLMRRIGVMEGTKFVPREEFETFRGDLRDSLSRIETEILERNRVERESK